MSYAAKINAILSDLDSLERMIARQDPAAGLILTIQQYSDLLTVPLTSRVATNLLQGLVRDRLETLRCTVADALRSPRSPHPEAARRAEAIARAKLRIDTEDARAGLREDN